MSGLFKKLSFGGGFAYKYLLHLYNEQRHIYLINSKVNLNYKGYEFLGSSFEYNPSENGGGSLKIELVENGGNAIKMFDESYNFNAEICGCLLEDGTVQEIGNYFHRNGNASWNGKEGTVEFDKDPRLNMTMPCATVIFDSSNNHGNN